MFRMAYWKDPFEILMQPKNLVEFYIVEVDDSVDGSKNLPLGHGHISTKHILSDVIAVRSHQIGQQDAKTFCCRTHLGHLIVPGDIVLGFKCCYLLLYFAIIFLGYDIQNSNLNDATFDTVKQENIPDAVLVRKVYDKSRRLRKRQWKLKRLYHQDEGASTIDEFNVLIKLNA
jgi:nonsense-mediated mRNA decay protein 3